MAINYDVEYPKLQRRVAELQRQLNESPEAMTIRFLAADLRANELQAKLDALAVFGTAYIWLDHDTNKVFVKVPRDVYLAAIQEQKDEQ